MKFHDAVFYDNVNKSKHGKDPRIETCSFFAKEWVRLSRPYYKSYPSITEHLLRQNLKFKMKELQLADRIFAIRFAVGKEPSVCDEHGRLFIGAILTAVATDSHQAKAMFLWGFVFRDREDAIATGSWIANMISDDCEHDLCTKCGADLSLVENGDSITPDESLCENIGDAILRCAVMVHLIAEDPSIITPDVLSSDRDRYDNEIDEAWKQRAVDRARRRGVVGWNIGADYEVCPHYRRPHFGLRHTGKGRTVPRIVPIKGAVVHRSRLTEVPTGWMTPDGREVEPVR